MTSRYPGVFTKYRVIFANGNRRDNAVNVARGVCDKQTVCDNATK